MRLVACLIVPLVLAGCGGSGPPLARGWIAPEADAAVTEAERRVLAEVVRSAEAHDWDAFAATLDPEGVARQTAFLLSPGEPYPYTPELARAQIVIETFCCPVPPFVEAPSYVRAGAEAIWAGLGRIERLRIGSVGPVQRGGPSPFRSVHAVVTLDDGSEHPVGLTLVEGAEGWALSVGAG